MSIIILLIVSSPFLAILAAFYAGYDVLRFGGKKKYQFHSSWPFGLFLLFFWSLLVSAINLHFMSALASFALGAYCLLAVYVHNRFQDEDRAEKLFYLAFLATVASAMVGVLENYYLINRDPAWWKYFFGMITVVYNQDTVERITGTFGNSNLAAAWYAVMVLVGYYFAEQGKGAKRVFLFAGMIFGLSALLMTESRGAMIGLFMGLVVYEFFSGVRLSLYRRLLLPFLVFLLIAILPWWFSWEDLSFPTLNLRWHIWENCFYMFLKKPVTGWGLLGIYYADKDVYQYLHVLHAHNFLLSILTMLGVVGVAIFAWMEWSLWQDLRCLWTAKSRLLPLLAGIHAIFIGHGLFDFTVMGVQVGILFFGGTAITGGLAKAEKNRQLACPAVAAGK